MEYEIGLFLFGAFVKSTFDALIPRAIGWCQSKLEDEPEGGGVVIEW